jgi:ABC-type branched-subunit amino acid transport system substrate-binding protein
MWQPRTRSNERPKQRPLRLQGLVVVVTVIAIIVSACGSSSSSSSSSQSSSGSGGTTSSAAASSSGPIKIGLITTLSGPLAPVFKGVNSDFLARIAWQNAQGGVNGRKLVGYALDDGGTPQGNLAAVESLVLSKHVIAVDEESPFDSGSFQFLHTHGIPVVGIPTDPHFGTKPYTNMFGDWGSTDPSTPVYTTVGEIFKKLGATSVAAAAFDNPASAHGAADASKSAAAVGLKAPYVNTSIPVGSNAPLSTIALAIKNSHADGLYPEMGGTPGGALITALKQAGSGVKYVDLVGNYAGIIGTPSQSVFAGSVFNVYWLPSQYNTAVTRQVTSVLKKYGALKGQPFYAFDIIGWLGANLAITGLENAGSNPTPASLIAGLQKVSNYNAGGLLPAKVNFSAASFGHGSSADLSANGCVYSVQLKGSQWVPFTPSGTKPFCGTLMH